ncbi:MAG TPA: class I SAM-dependent methyltransferase [Acidimicrobiales bacterium]|nr:class I SAM-dependent methyltransferase [Acidimicrobiales bacterium]
MTAVGQSRDDTDDQVLDEEFDQLAVWTADAIEALALPDAIPAACNGSGSPASLTWLGEAMRLGAGSVVLDTGAGLGGPAEWLARGTGARIVASEPMIGAARGCRRLFDRPAVVAWSHRLPFAGGTFDGALALAVLSTAQDKDAYLGEVRRILRPGGRLGLLEYVRTSADLPDPPVNNRFLGPGELDRIVGDHGFRIDATAMSDDLPSAPEEWTSVADRVNREVSERHRGAGAARTAEEQQDRFARLLSTGALRIRLLCAVRL